jgi:PST family polysaccharide transporter
MRDATLSGAPSGSAAPLIGAPRPRATADESRITSAFQHPRREAAERDNRLMAKSSSSRLRLDPAELFVSGHLSGDLAGKTARGGLSALVSQAAQFLVQAVGVVVLARILTPADYGIVGMVAVFIGLAQVFKDGGLAMGTIQRDEISAEQISTVFWMNVALLGIVGLAVVAAGPLLAAFFRQPELAPVTAVLGLAFIVNGLSVQHDALLRRHMRFTAVAITQVVPLVLSLATSITLALLGWGYWALVAGTVVVAISSTALSYILCPWIPGWVRRGTGALHLLRFGGDLTAFNVFDYFAQNADNILVGRVIGASALGLYSKAYSLFVLPMTQIRVPLSGVAMPVLSSLKSQPERYRRYYRKFLGAVAFATLPLSVYCVLQGDFLIALLLGPKWAGAAPVFRILALASIVQAPASTRGLVLISLGRSRRFLWLGVVNSIVMVIAFVIGLRWGITGVAAAYAAANWLMLIPTLVFAFRGTPVSVGLFFGVLARPGACVVAAAALSLVVYRLTGDTGMIPHAVFFVVFFGTYALLASRSGFLRETWKAFIGGVTSTPIADANVDVEKVEL